MGSLKKTTESENLQAQAPQAHEGEPPQEAVALQELDEYSPGHAPDDAPHRARSRNVRRPSPRSGGDACRASFVVAAPGVCLGSACACASPTPARPARSPRRPRTGRCPRRWHPPETGGRLRRRLPPAGQGSAPRPRSRAQGRGGRPVHARADPGGHRRRGRREDEYLKALALDPGNAELSVKVAWDDLRRGDTPGAINLLKDTIKAAPKQAQPYSRWPTSISTTSTRLTSRRSTPAGAGHSTRQHPLPTST